MISDALYRLQKLKKRSVIFRVFTSCAAAKEKKALLTRTIVKIEIINLCFCFHIFCFL